MAFITSSLRAAHVAGVVIEANLSEATPSSYRTVVFNSLATESLAHAHLE